MLLAPLLHSTTEPATGQIAGGRPNIVFILTDDQDASTLPYMPNLQRLLVDQGTTFRNFFFSHALCCPSRATMLRGQYEHNHGVRDNHAPEGGWQRFHQLGLENDTVATWLHDAGYRTAYMGKYLNDYAAEDPTQPANTYVPPGWDDWRAFARRDLRTNYYRDYDLNENGTIVSYGRRQADYSTDVLATKAADFIRAGQDSTDPFFLYFVPYAPHAPAIPARRHATMFGDVRAPRPPSFNEADTSDKPAYIRNLDLLTEDNVATIDKNYRQRLRTLQAVDDAIGTIVGTLEATGQLQNTYLFFVSDNGFSQGTHRLRAGKDRIYDEETRFPLTVRGPGVPAGQRTDLLAGNTDLAPTFAALGGASVPSWVDGRSLVPAWGLLSPVLPLFGWRTGFLLEKTLIDEHNGEMYGVREGDLVYVEYRTGEREFYDLSLDPYQLTNTYGTASPDLLARLQARLAALKTCAADTCRTAEDRLDLGLGQLPILGT